MHLSSLVSVYICPSVIVFVCGTMTTWPEWIFMISLVDYIVAPCRGPWGIDGERKIFLNNGIVARISNDSFFREDKMGSFPFSRWYIPFYTRANLEKRFSETFRAISSFGVFEKFRQFSCVFFQHPPVFYTNLAICVSKWRELWRNLLRFLWVDEMNCHVLPPFVSWQNRYPCVWFF